MSYRINVWMEYGEPRLGIVHAETGDIQLQWQLNRVDIAAGQARKRRLSPSVKKSGLQHLLRELFLVSCAQDIGLMQRLGGSEIDETCLRCERCGDAPLDLNLLLNTSKNNVIE